MLKAKGALLHKYPATTARKMNNALDDVRDKTAQSNSYVKVNDIDLKKVVVPTKNH